LRIAHFPAAGRLEGLVWAQDTLLVWSGGRSEVTLSVRLQQQLEQLSFVRRAGTIDLVPTGTVIEELSWQGQACSCIEVAFEPDSLERLLGVRAALPPDGLRVAVPDAHAVEIVQQLQAQVRTGQPWGSAYVEALSSMLASYVYGRYAARESVAEPDQASVSAAWQRVVAFVEEHLGHDIGVADLALLTGYSSDHFTRLFKRSFGISPYQYVIERRVERAKALLRVRTHSIAEVATACGFSTQAHLYTAFKARLGVTPGAYRKG
jgi:AraC family transcriptional regulator